MENKITANGVTFYQDWDKYGGSIVMVVNNILSAFSSTPPGLVTLSGAWP